MSYFGTVGKGKTVHILIEADKPATLCDKVATAFVTDEVADAAKTCQHCDRIERTLESTSGETEMVTKSDEATTPVVTRDEEIRANIERVRSLAEADNVEGAAELTKETEGLISGIKGAGSTAIRKEWRSQLSEAAKAMLTRPAEVATVAATAVVVPETSDYHEAEGVPELVTMAAGVVKDAVGLELKGTETARRVAEMLLDMRRRIHNKQGVPDLKAASDAAKQASKDMYAAARSNMSGPKEVIDDAVERLQRAVNFQMSDVVVNYVRGLDDDRTEFDTFFGTVKAKHPELSPSDAVFTFYKLRRESEVEAARRRRAEKALEAEQRKALTAGDSGEAGEGEGEGEAGETAEPETAESVYTSALKAAVDTSKAMLRLKRVKFSLLDDEQREELEEQVKSLEAAVKEIRKALI